MISCLVHQNELILGLNKKVIFINLENYQILREIVIPDNAKLPSSESTEVDEGKSVNEKENITKIQLVAISPNADFLAIITSGQKLLLLYRIEPDNIVLLSKRSIARTTSAVTFSWDSTKILIADKAGDCFVYDCINVDSPAKWVLGHLSMILDVLFSTCGKYIITCDRDEKVRITNFPDCHEIESYCLGHLEYISAISFLPQNPNQYLVSLSGDNTIRIWSYISGIQEHEISIPAPGVKFAIRKFDHNTCHIAVIVYQPNESIFIYKLSYENGKFTSNLISKKAYPSEIMTNLCFNNDKLFCVAVLEGSLQIKIVKYEDDEYINEDSDSLCTILEKIFPNEKIDYIENISGWFKKKFDNVTEYLERKKRRIEEKQKQSS